MNIKFKTFFMLMGIMGIGVGIGALIHDAVMKQRIQRALTIRNPLHLAKIYQQELDSSPENAAQIQEILGRHAGIVAEIREHFVEEMSAANESLWEELEPVLTPEQKRLLGKRFFGPRDFPPPGPDFPDPSFREGWINKWISEMQAELKLSAEQADRIRGILRAARVPAWDNLRQMEQNFIRMRERMDRMINETQRKIEQVLTEEQRIIFRQMNKNRFLFPRERPGQKFRPPPQRRKPEK